MSKIIKIIRKIIIGPGMDRDARERPAAAGGSLRDEVRAVWNDVTLSSYGIERVMRLFFILIQFIYPTVLIRTMTGRLSLTWQKLIVDIYVLMKLAWLLFVLTVGWYENIAVICITVYILSETVLYILSLIVLADIYSYSVSFIRSMMMILINYIQIALGFAVIYLKFDLVNGSLTPLSAVYYSLVTTTTLGYGDYYPREGAGQVVVMLQLAIFVLFVLLFINYFSQGIRTAGKKDGKD